MNAASWGESVSKTRVNDKDSRVNAHKTRVNDENSRANLSGRLLSPRRHCTASNLPLGPRRQRALRACPGPPRLNAIMVHTQATTQPEGEILPNQAPPLGGVTFPFRPFPIPEMVWPISRAIRYAASWTESPTKTRSIVQ